MVDVQRIVVVMKKTVHIDIFRYRDYRQFLRDWYAHAKSSRATFSFRAFSQRAGFTSPNFFKLVMDGARNLTEESLAKFVVGLKLNKQEQEFFRNLVFFSQAKDNEAKDRYYRAMLRSRKLRRLQPIEKEKHEYYATWYHPVIRELIAAPEFDGTAEWLAARLYPPITKEQAEKSIELLARLGFIERMKDNRWKQSNPLVSSGPEPASHILFNYHLNMLDLAKGSLRHVGAEKRDVSALTLGVAASRVPQLKQMIREFRNEVLRLASEDANPEEVVQLNIQMFPVTEREKASKRKDEAS